MAITADTKTETRTYFSGDHSLPSLGQIQLLPSSLTSQEQDLVIGDVRRDITGNVYYTLTGNLSSLVTMNESESVMGDRDFYLLGSLSDQVVGTAMETRYGKHFYHNACERTDTFTGQVHHFYQAQLDEHHPETWMKKIQTFMHYENFAMKTGIMTVTAIANANSFYGIKADFSGMKVDGSWRKIEYGQTKTTITAIKNDIHLQARKVVLTAVLVGALYAGTPFKPNALPRPSPLTPLD